MGIQAFAITRKLVKITLGQFVVVLFDRLPKGTGMHAAAQTGHRRTDRTGRDDHVDSDPVSRNEGQGAAENVTPPTSDHESGCNAQQVRSALASALESPEFRSAPQLRSFLDFVVRAALENDLSKIKGYTIAVEALGRPEDFNPVTDPIVRVEAARLRRRLAKYYSGSGNCAHVRIVIPKGSYAPEFKLRPVAEQTRQPPSAVAHEASAPASGKRNEATGNAGQEAIADVPGGHLSAPDAEDAEPAPLHTYKVVQPLSGNTMQPLFSKRIPLALAMAMALVFFLAGLLAGSI